MEDSSPQYDRVIAYIRKSSEDNLKGEANKQLNSLEYQKNFVKEAIERYKLKLVGPVFEDDKTGYEAFQRDGFQAMLDYLRDHKDQVDGIICTEISRLARNFADGGMILWYLQKGIIRRIYTPSKVFTDSSGDQLMVAIEFAMSKKSSDDTGYRVKEAMKTKALIMKHPPRPPILGYVSQGKEGRKEWRIDEVKGPKVIEIFKQYSTGQFTLDQIADFAYSIGLRSRDSKSLSGKLSKNTWRNRLSDLQYTGLFEYDGEKIVGEYTPLVETDLFYDVQEILNDHQHPKVTHLDYAYSGIIKCGNCGGMLSGTNKKGTTYYRCGKKAMPCKNIEKISYLTEPELENRLFSEFEKIEIDEETWKEARAYVEEINQPQKLDLKKQIRMIGEKIEAEKNIQIEFGRKYAERELTKDEHNRLMKDSYAKEALYRNTMIKCENILHELDELMYGFLDNIKYVTKRLLIALPENKRELVSIFCENLEWKDETLRWNWTKPYYLLANRPKNSTVLSR